MMENFVQVVPLIYDAIFQKGAIFVFNKERYIEAVQGTRISLPVKAGDELFPGSSSYQVMQTGQKYSAEVDASVLGVPYFASAYPVIIDGEVIGGISICVPSELMSVSEDLQATATDLAASLQQIAAAIENISGNAQQLAHGGQSLTESSKFVHEKAAETEEVVQYIDSVASDTKLLGLNASIEAARAGDVGRGFAVVASEIQKMAVSSASSAKEIRKIIGGIRELIGGMVNDLSTFGTTTQDVSAAIQEIAASIESLTELSENLQNLSTKL